MIGRENLREGMTVLTADGHKLGKVSRLGATDFEIEKGAFFKKDYIADYSKLMEVRGDEAILSVRKEDIGKEHRADYGYGEARGTTATGGEDVRVPVAEEELDVLKRQQLAGEVRVTKDVVTEQKQVSVPVTKEQVRVERVPVAPGESAGREAEIRGESVSVPIHEEEVEIRKRPVVREEIRLHKERVEEPRMVAETVRKERVNVEGEGELERPARTPGSPGDEKTRY
jgi:uncharacterized protein (TIGR02271 family)